MNSSLRHAMRDLAAEVLFAAGITRPSRVASGRLVIATFHRVLPALQRDQYPFPDLVVTPEELDWFLRFFRRHFDCGTLAESLRKWKTGEPFRRPLLAITFDDGQLDNFLHARSVLDRQETRATFFVTSQGASLDQTLWYDRLGYGVLRLLGRKDGSLERFLTDSGIPESWSALSSKALVSAIVEKGKHLAPAQVDEWLVQLEDHAGHDLRPSWDGMMGWQQLSALARDGHEIGSHTTSHRILTTSSSDEIDLEVTESRRVLQEQLDLSIDSFCYPNGNYDDRAIAALQGAGYTSAVTTAWGLNEPRASLYTLKRCDMVTGHSTRGCGTLSAPRVAWRMSGLHPGLM